MAASTVQVIGTFLIQEAGELYGVEEQVQGLQEELQIMQQYLHDADARQEDREVCALVRQIRKLAYDAEDVIDTYIFKVQKSNGGWLTRFTTFLYKFPQLYEVRQQIRLIQTSLKRVSDKLNSHGVRRITNLDTSPISRNERYRRQRPQSYPYDDSDGEFVVGMEEDIQNLVDVVMGEGRTQVGVICIVGMGGSGKTTLARKLYNHPYAKECFDCSAWVFISQEWSTQHVLLEILRKVGGLKHTTKLDATSSVEEVVDKLRDVLEKKSYLVVLDDVWRRDALEEILSALPRGRINKGSKIIITTRNREIFQSRICQKEHLYILEPRPLTEESSWELFSKIALSHRTSYEEQSFKNVGKEMLKNCDGLPLAIVALAGILNTRTTIGEWQQVGETVRSRILEGTCSNMYGRVGELLAMSYDDLPYDLKPCFLYLGVFPEDCTIPVGMLTRMWVAEGLVSTQYTEMSLEDVALQRLEELSHRFLIQVVTTNCNGAIKAFRLHDLLSDLCVQKAKEQSFLHIFAPGSCPGSGHTSMLEIQPRRAALHSSTYLPAQVSYLRSLVLMTQSSISCSAYSSKETFDVQLVPKNFRLLRLLSIWGIKTVTGILPMQIGSLIHLRYLEIRATNITGLPSSIGGLRNLLTLDYRDVDLENKVHIKIPNVFQKLVLLRNLFLPIEYPWSMDMLKLSTIRNLRTLWGLRLDNNMLLRELPQLSTTLKKLKIVVSSENELKAAFCCPSLMTDVLLTLHCELRGGIALCSVEPLCNRQHLLKLTVIGEIQMELSLLLPMNLVRLELRDSMIKDLNPMAALGTLAHLKRLNLSNAFVGTTLTCRCCSFPQLEELNVERHLGLETWEIEKGAMPCLKKLEITKCWSLKEFPLGLKFVTTLQLFDFFDMPLTFCKTAREIGWAPQKLRLPHNFAAIIEHSDIHIDSSSIRNLYEQLAVGIFLDNKTKKYWVTNHQGNYYNCFMVYASALRLGSELLLDVRNTNKNKKDPSAECREVMEKLSDSSEDATTVTVTKLSSSVSAVYPEVIGKFDLGNLSMEVTYKIFWVIMLEEADTSKKKWSTSFMDEVEGPTLVHTKLNGKDLYTEEILGKRINEWIHISGGKFETHPKMKKEVELSLSYEEGFDRLDLIIKGFIIQPEFAIQHTPCIKNDGN